MRAPRGLQSSSSDLAGHAWRVLKDNGAPVEGGGGCGHSPMHPWGSPRNEPQQQAGTEAASTSSVTARCDEKTQNKKTETGTKSQGKRKQTKQKSQKERKNPQKKGKTGGKRKVTESRGGSPAVAWAPTSVGGQAPPPRRPNRGHAPRRGAGNAPRDARAVAAEQRLDRVTQVTTSPRRPLPQEGHAPPRRQGASHPGSYGAAGEKHKRKPRVSPRRIVSQTVTSFPGCVNVGNVWY